MNRKEKKRKRKKDMKVAENNNKRKILFASWIALSATAAYCRVRGNSTDTAAVVEDLAREAKKKKGRARLGRHLQARQ